MKNEEFVSSHANEIVAVWVASKEYVNEACKSAESVARHMPDIRRVLLCDSPCHRSVFDMEEIFDLYPSRWYLRSTEMLVKFYQESAYRGYLYFDTDTYMLSPIHDVLELVDLFDIVGTHAPGRITGKPVLGDIIPNAFPEINMGVTLFSKNERIDKLMEKWLINYKIHEDYYGNNDQIPLRDAMWVCCHPPHNLRLYILPPEYNCRFGFGGFARYPVKVLHGRSSMDMEEIGNSINSSQDMRTWTREKYG